MKDNKKEVTPIIVNGELNMRKKRKVKNSKRDNLPKKTFGFSDIILSLIGLLLVIYGGYTIINKEDKEDDIKNEPAQSNVIDQTKKDGLTIDSIKKHLSFDKEELSNIYNLEDLQQMANGLNVANLSNNAKLSLAMKFTTPHVVAKERYVLEDELDYSIKNLFGNEIVYQKAAFTFGDNIYTYNQEMKRYYLMDNTKKLNLAYNKFDYSEAEEMGDKLIIREYIAYTDLSGTKSWTLNNMALKVVINDHNIKEQYTNLKYFEYAFVKDGESYRLVTITIK